MGVKIFGIGNISKKLNRVVAEAIQDTTLLDRVGRLGVRSIQERTRKGLGADLGPFPPLAESTKKSRGRLAKENKVSAYFQGRSVSNLHLTGQLIRSIVAEITTKSNSIFGAIRPGRVELSTSGDRTPYTTRSELRENKKGTKVRRVKTLAGSTPSNQVLTRYLALKGFIFMGADDEMKQKIRDMVALHVKQVVRRIGRK